MIDTLFRDTPQITDTLVFRATLRRRASWLNGATAQARAVQRLWSNRPGTRAVQWASP